MLRGLLLLLNQTGALRLVMKLLLDRRVPLRLKMLFPAALAYVVLPFDLVPDFLIGLGQIDDLIAVVLAFVLFLGMAPREIVNEHRGRSPTDGAGGSPDRGKVIDGEYKVIDDDK
jgi:carbonic anhydrase